MSSQASNFRTRCLNGRRRKGDPIDELHDSGRYECFGDTRPYGIVPVGGQSKKQVSQFRQVTPPITLVMIAAVFALLAVWGYLFIQHLHFS